MRVRLPVLWLAGILLLAACNFPSAQGTQPGNAPGIETIAAQTIAAQQTILAGTPRPTITPAPVTVLPGGATVTPAPALPTDTAAPGAPSSTPKPTDTPATPCNRAEFVADVTVPDDTQYRPGDTFTKTWRLKNTGTCTWTTSYDLVFAKGEQMGAPAEIPLAGTVAPGQTVDLSVKMTAPSALGTYQSDWQLRDEKGIVFGIGEQADKTFWVRIKVTLPGGITYDFLAQASSADWTYDTGTESGSLTFNGAAGDPHGMAAIKKDLKLEDGRTTGTVLYTIPPQNNGSALSAVYPAYKVYRGDRLKGLLGFEAESDGSCGAGEAVFIIRYREVGDSTLHTLGQWSDSCDGSLVKVDVDLSDLAGKEVQFILVFDSDGDYLGDRGVWSSLRVER